jgi:hypothetical protein
MNGVVAVVCSEIARARLHSASDTFCGENAGRDAGLADRDDGGVGRCEYGLVLKEDEDEVEGVGGANSFKVSSISSSNYHSSLHQP